MYVSKLITGSLLELNYVRDQRKSVPMCNTKADSLGCIDQHHAGAVLLDEPNPSEDQVNM